MQNRKKDSNRSGQKSHPGKHDVIFPEQLVEEIRKRAHEIFLEHGGSAGSPLDDWLKAEREVKARYGIK